MEVRFNSLEGWVYFGAAFPALEKLARRRNTFLVACFPASQIATEICCWDNVLPLQDLSSLLVLPGLITARRSVDDAARFGFVWRVCAATIQIYWMVQIDPVPGYVL